MEETTLNKKKLSVRRYVSAPIVVIAVVVGALALGLSPAAAATGTGAGTGHFTFQNSEISPPGTNPICTDLTFQFVGTYPAATYTSTNGQTYVGPVTVTIEGKAFANPAGTYIDRNCVVPGPRPDSVTSARVLSGPGPAPVGFAVDCQSPNTAASSYQRVGQDYVFNVQDLQCKINGLGEDPVRTDQVHDGVLTLCEPLVGRPTSCNSVDSFVATNSVITP